MNFTNLVRQHWAALRALLVLTVITGFVYPLIVWGVALLPGLHAKAEGSIVDVAGKPVGSKLIGQSFTDKDGNPLVQYFQSRPSHAGDGYDPTATSASNLGPENVVDILPDPKNKDDTGTQSLLTQVCSQSLAVGKLEGVDGSRPFCTSDGIGAVLVVVRAGGIPAGKITAVYSVNQECPATPFISTYQGVTVQCAQFGTDYTTLGFITPIRGHAPAHSAVPSDAVTGSGSGQRVRASANLPLAVGEQAKSGFASVSVPAGSESLLLEVDSMLSGGRASGSVRLFAISSPPTRLTA